jgi:hypothetical protein
MSQRVRALPAVFLFILGLLALVPSPAPAQSNSGKSSRLYKEGITGPEFQAILKRLGHATQLKADSEGDPELSGRIENVTYTILFYGCNKAKVRRCLSYQYYIGFTDMTRLTTEQVNQWNVKKRFGAASLRDGNVAELRMSANIAGGVTEGNFAEWLEWWKVGVREFKDHIGYR